MRINEELLQTVAFIGSRQSDGTFQALGTGFFVGVDPDYPYLVTALHVAQHLQDQPYVMRFNPQPYMRASGRFIGYQDMELQRIQRWYIHPNDSSIDIAVVPLASLSPCLLAHKTIPTRMFFMYKPKGFEYTSEEAEQALMQAYAFGQPKTSEPGKQPIISIGDETHTIGLYSLVPGKNDNVPVVRIGNIAMMPGEPICCRDSVDRELYLIEMRSTGGLSGSPVFAFSPITRTMFLIGMIHGHHDFTDDANTRNTGIAMVTPIQKLVDILESEELVELRRQDVIRRQKDAVLVCAEQQGRIEENK